MGLTRSFAKFIQGVHFNDLTERSMSEAKKCFLDGIGLIVAGSVHQASKILREYVRGAERQGSCSTLGVDSIMASVANAALVNGVSCHVHDFDDTQRYSGGHPTAVVLPVVLALSEHIRASGKDALTSFIAGVEVFCKMGRLANPSLYKAGLHVTSAIGVLGAVGAAGKLLGLRENELSHALGIAGSMSCGLKVNFGTMTKPLHVGFAASNGIFATFLAKKGWTASTQVLESDNGFFSTLARCEAPQVNLSDLKRNLDIERPGMTRKKYPCCLRAHTSIDAVRKIVQEHVIAVEDVKEIICYTDATAFSILQHRYPKDEMEARFSLPFCVAVSFLKKDISPTDFSPVVVKDKLVTQTIRKVRHLEDVAFTRAGYEHRNKAKVIVRLKNGKELGQVVERCKGDPENPLTNDELTKKFRSCTRDILSPKQIESAIDLMDGLEKLDSLDSVIETLKVEIK